MKNRDLLHEYSECLMRLFVAVANYEKAIGLKQRLSPTEISRLADCNPAKLSPLEIQVREAVLEIEKLRLRALSYQNGHLSRAFDRILEDIRARFRRS